MAVTCDVSLDCTDPRCCASDFVRAQIKIEQISQPFDGLWHSPADLVAVKVQLLQRRQCTN
jgi:hypothetical protein